MCAERSNEESPESPDNGIDPMSHVPVMADEVLEFLSHGHNEGLLVDGTAGIAFGRIARNDFSCC